MEQMEELQRRIEGALERIGSGVDALENGHASALAAAQEAGKSAEPTNDEDVDPAAVAELREQLDDEKTANAQLTARNDQLHSRVTEMEQKVAAVDKVDQIVAMEAELELLRNEAAQGGAEQPSPEAEALRQEVARLKGEQESFQNQAAAERDLQQDRIDALEAKLVEAEAAIAEVDTAGEEAPENSGENEILLNEISVLQDQLAAANASLEAAEAKPAPQQDPVHSEALESKLAALDADLQSLRAANDQLRTANAALRDANAEGVGNTDLINQALAAEVEGLRAARAADQSEIEAILARLSPLFPQSADTETPDESAADASAAFGDEQPEGETA